MGVECESDFGEGLTGTHRQTIYSNSTACAQRILGEGVSAEQAARRVIRIAARAIAEFAKLVDDLGILTGPDAWVASTRTGKAIKAAQNSRQ